MVISSPGQLGSARKMKANTDGHQMQRDEALSANLSLTLPARLAPTLAVVPRSLNREVQTHQPPSCDSAVSEITALVALATALGEAPHTACQVLADNLLALLNAGSAGVSVLSVQSDGDTLVSWPAIAGLWQGQSGESRLLHAPVSNLDHLVEHFLVVPFCIAGRMAGTVWAVTHDTTLGFDAEDIRKLQNLARFAAPALLATAALDSAHTTLLAKRALRTNGTPDRRHATQYNLIDNAPFGVYVIDSQFRMCQASAAAHKAFASVHPLIGRDFGAIVHMVWPKPFAFEVLTHFRHTLDSGEAYAAPTATEMRKDLPDIESYDWKIERIILPDGTFGVVCYFYDLTERINAQALIRESEMRYRAFVTASSDAVYRMSPDWREMRHLQGRNFMADAHEPTAQWLQDYIYPEDQARVLAAINAAIATKGMFELEHRVLREDGSLGWTQSRAVPLLDVDGTIMEWIGTATDVTGRKRIEADLIAALASAENANQAKSDFLSRMSHELRSPLNAVLGFAQLVQASTPPPTALQEKNMGEILKAGWYLLGLIDEILDLSQIESGHLSFVLEPVSLAEVLNDCQSLVEGQAAARSIHLNPLQIDRHCIAIVDRNRIKQVFINLLSNAIKYNRKGGTVQVHCEGEGLGRICIRIEDTGSGLSPQQLSHIFEPFERLGQEAGSIEGTGIGLALSKRLVELMGGRIGVQSAVGQGSVFWVELDAPIAK
jgi:signal transduction histidine kinase